MSERWICPVCHGINVVRGEQSAAGYCQHARCCDRRGLLLATGARILPELCLVLGMRYHEDAGESPKVAA